MSANEKQWYTLNLQFEASSEEIAEIVDHEYALYTRLIMALSAFNPENIRICNVCLTLGTTALLPSEPRCHHIDSGGHPVKYNEKCEACGEIVK